MSSRGPPVEVPVCANRKKSGPTARATGTPPQTATIGYSYQSQASFHINAAIGTIEGPLFSTLSPTLFLLRRKSSTAPPPVPCFFSSTKILNVDQYASLRYRSIAQRSFSCVERAQQYPLPPLLFSSTPKPYPV